MTFEIKNLYKKFGEKTAVDQLSLSIQEGEILGLLGRNGAGKTTTIRMILELIPKDSGEITMNGKPFNKHNFNIGYLPEERGLYPKMNALEQIIYFARLEGMNYIDAKNAALKWIERLEIKDAKHKKTEQLSKGNQQKIQLITALIHDPEFIILDEPFSGLDPVNAELLKSVVIDEIQKQKTIIFCSHQMDQVESFCDKVSIMKDGRLIVNDTVKNIKSEYEYFNLEIEPNKPIGNFLAQKALKYEKNKKNYKLTLQKGYPYLTMIQDIDNAYGLNEFSVKSPTLHQIFLERMGDVS